MTDSFLQRIWYGKSPLSWLLWPLSLVFIWVTWIRRSLYRSGVLRTHRVDRPVIVVGNITVGGTGKTPLVLWLAASLRTHGMVPAIITRGYGGAAVSWPQIVSAANNPTEVGDEAVLLAQRFGGIVVAGPDRVASARKAIELGATIVVSDDGLQHYRLSRNFEIAVVDAERDVGNGFRLPAGPLRESESRLGECDAVVRHVRSSQRAAAAQRKQSFEYVMRSHLGAVYSLATQERRALSSFAASPVNAIAAIGNPNSFFESLRNAGLKLTVRALQDHAALTARDVSFENGSPVLMTEKDAVKCRGFADDRCWAVALEVEVEDGNALLDAIVRKLDTETGAAHSAHS